MIAMKHYLLIVLYFLGFLSPLSLFAQHEPTPDHLSHQTVESSSLPNEQTPEVPYHHDYQENDFDSFQTKFLNMLFILGLLIGFMILASWALKRMVKTRVTHLNTTSLIKVLETRNLSPRSTLYLLDVQGQALLIAESPTTITHLASFPLEEEYSRELNR